MNISSYPILQSVLIEVIPQHAYGNLQRFNTCALPVAKRESLISAYKDDVTEDNLSELLNDNIGMLDLAEAYKNGSSLDVVLDNIISERIYDLAQEMGSILEEIERSNNTADRINE